MLCGRDSARLCALQRSLDAQQSSKCDIVVGDIRTSETQHAFAAALQQCQVNIFINNAAVNTELGRDNNFHSADEISNVISTNTTAAIALCLSAFEHFRRNAGGIIVNINSIAGLLGSRHEPLYAASKFGLRGFSESVKDAWLGQGIRMIDAYPGAIATGMSATRTDVNDLIDPDELASFVVYLCNTRTFYAREINIQKTPLAARQTFKGQ